MTNPSKVEARQTIAVVGAGRVATAVAHLLARAGHAIAGVGHAGRTSTTRASQILGAPEFSAGELPPADLVLIGVPDAAIEEVARAVAEEIAPSTVVCHFAGSLGVEPLRPVAAAGGLVCALHPVQTCPSVEAAIARLPGSAWGVTCSDGLLEWVAHLVTDDLDGIVVGVDEADRPIWHAASVTTANGVSALLAAAESMLAGLGVADPSRVLAPLAAGSVANARSGGGGAQTLTGPIVRGETATVRRHLDAFGVRAPEILPLYRRTSLLILDAARRAGRIDSSTAAAMTALLETR